MHVWKLMLTALGSGALFGTIGGTTIDPIMKPPPEQPWRQGLGPQAPLAAYAVVEAGPTDLAPQGWTYGAARAFPADVARPAARQLGYRWEEAALTSADADEGWRYAALSEDEPVRASEAAPVAMDVPVLEAADAANDAARDAADAESQSAAPPVI